jgi:hypothetical protein
VEHLSYFQVDNPLVHCIDPLFIGLHDITGSEMSSKTISKAEPLLANSMPAHDSTRHHQVRRTHRQEPTILQRHER